MLSYVRQTGEPHETREDALDTLAGALAIENVHFGFVDSLNRAVLFADCGEYTRGLTKDQMLVSGILGKGFDRTIPSKPVVMVAVQSFAPLQRMSTLEMMAERSEWLLFGHGHPTDSKLCVLYLPEDHQIGGLSNKPQDFELPRVCLEPGKKAD